MSGDLRVLVNTSAQLSVDSPTHVPWLIYILALSLGAVIFGLIYLTNRATMPKGQKIYLLCLWFLCAVIGIVTSIWGHTVTLTRPSNDVTIVDRFAGIPYSTRHYPLSDIRQAIMEYARPGTRIALVMQNGAAVWPLGKAYNPKPSQYKVINLINDFVHGVQQTSGSPQVSPALSKHLRELQQETEETQRENAEALRKAAKKTDNSKPENH